MTIEDEARICYKKARAFLKGGAKADNKCYLGDVDKREESIERRAATDALPFIRDDYSVSWVTLGDLLRATGNTRANCRESTALAASYVTERMPNAPVFAVSSDADHSFLMVGKPRPVGSNGSLRNLRELARVPPQQPSFILDPWAGIFCHASEYPVQFKQKMERWKAQTKIILVPPGKGLRMPTDLAAEVMDAPARLKHPFLDLTLASPEGDREMIRYQLDQKHQKKQEDLRLQNQTKRHFWDIARQDLARIDNDADRFIRERHAAWEHKVTTATNRADWENASGELGHIKWALMSEDNKNAYLVHVRKGIGSALEEETQWRYRSKYIQLQTDRREHVPDRQNQPVSQTQNDQPPPLRRSQRFVRGG